VDGSDPREQLDVAVEQLDAIPERPISAAMSTRSKNGTGNSGAAAYCSSARWIRILASVRLASRPVWSWWRCVCST
jgi:hypothetical protein